MAVIIIQEPENFTPSDNPVRFTFESDEFAQPNFSFLVEVSVNGVVHSNHLVFPEVADNRAHYDATEIAQVSCSVPAIAPGVFIQDAGNLAEVRIKVYERYGSPIATQASAQSKIVRVFKASLSDEDFVDWDSDAYLLDNSGALWLTLFPRTERYLCGMTEDSFFMFLTSYNNNYNLLVKLYDANDTLIA